VEEGIGEIVWSERTLGCCPFKGEWIYKIDEKDTDLEALRRHGSERE